MLFNWRGLRVIVEGKFARMGQPGACDRLAEGLGMPAPKGETPDQTERRRTTAAKLSALVIANALIFQEQLTMTDGRVMPLGKLDGQQNSVAAARVHWQFIWQEIPWPASTSSTCAISGWSPRPAASPAPASACT